MKILPLLLITALPLISANAIAEAQPAAFDVGLAHKAYSIDIPSPFADNSKVTTSNISAFGLLVEEEINQYFTVQFEIAKGYTTDDTSSLFISDGSTVAETFETQLDYSIGMMGKILPLGIKTLSPIILIGATTTSISYDYLRIKDNAIDADKSKTETSSGIQYGLGIEYNAADDLDISLTYVDLSNLKYDAYTVNFELVIKL